MQRMRRPWRSGSFARFQRWLVAAMLLFAMAAPSLAGKVRSRMNEAKTPIESEEESQGKVEEAVVYGQRRFRWKPTQHDVLTIAHHDVRVHRSIATGSSRCVKGHRLSKELLAPMTC